MVSFSSLSRLGSLISLALLFTSHVTSTPMESPGESGHNRPRRNTRRRERSTESGNGNGAQGGTSSSHEAATSTPTFYAGEGSSAGQFASHQDPVQMHDFFADSSSSLHHQQQHSSSVGPSSSTQPTMPLNFPPPPQFDRDASVQEIADYTDHQQRQHDQFMAMTEDFIWSQQQDLLHGQMQRLQQDIQQQQPHPRRRNIRPRTDLGHQGASSSRAQIPTPAPLSMMPPGGYSIMPSGSGSRSAIPHYMPSGDPRIVRGDTSASSSSHPAMRSRRMGYDPSAPIDLETQAGPSQPGSSEAGPSQDPEYLESNLLLLDNTIKEVLPTTKPDWAGGMSNTQMLEVLRPVTKIWKPWKRLTTTIRALIDLNKFLSQNTRKIPLLARSDPNTCLQIASAYNAADYEHKEIYYNWQTGLEQTHPSIVNQIYHYVLEQMKDLTYEDQLQTLELLGKQLNLYPPSEALSKALREVDKKFLDTVIAAIRPFKTLSSQQHQGQSSRDQ